MRHAVKPAPLRRPSLYDGGLHLSLARALRPASARRIRGVLARWRPAPRRRPR